MGFLAMFTFQLDNTKAKLLQLKLIHIFARATLLMKKLKIEKTKPTFIISVLKVDNRWP
jgi:ABC-type iron transport system FetAB permease component